MGVRALGALISHWGELLPRTRIAATPDRDGEWPAAEASLMRAALDKLRAWLHRNSGPR
jgi:hypothetical protein